jgi:phosphatidate cytidylyltransferase
MKSFLLRTVSSVLLISLFGCSILMKNSHGYALFALMSVILSYLAAKELCGMLAKVGRESFPWLASATCASIVAVFLLKSTPLGLFLGIAAILLSCSQGWLILLFAKGRLETLEKVLNTLAVVFLLALPFCVLVSIYMVAEGSYYIGRNLMLFLIIVTKAGDIGAYLVGSVSNRILAGGNHKMVPSISPGKSWEGAAGGLALSVGLSIALGERLTVSGSPLILAMLGLVLFLGGFVGDLAESALKRICGVKDSGHTLPGIGGVLDLLDSLMLNAPIFALFMTIQLMLR